MVAKEKAKDSSGYHKLISNFFKQPFKKEEWEQYKLTV